MKKFCCDIDGVLATQMPPDRYHDAEPIRENVDRINRLHALGHHIVLFTARGSATGIDWREVTERQMREWGVQYHELRFGKPAADYYIDDRALLPDQLEAVVIELAGGAQRREEG